MEIKRNEATLNRPLGDRVIDAPFVFANLKAFTEQVKDEKAGKKNDRSGITVFKTVGMTVVLTILKKGAMIKDNTVNGFFTIQVLDGAVRINTSKEDINMKKRRMIVFHPGVAHSIKASKNSVLLLTSTDVSGPGTEPGVI